jgi:hypothetical protein
MDTLMHLTINALLVLIGLSGFKDVWNKKRAWLLLLGYFNKVGFVNRKDA